RGDPVAPRAQPATCKWFASTCRRPPVRVDWCIMALRRDDLETLKAAVREAGLRATPSRIAVLHLLRSAGSPVSHSEVVAKLASQAWDPATIYRNLTDLADVGLARRTDVGDHVWRFRRSRAISRRRILTSCARSAARS